MFRKSINAAFLLTVPVVFSFGQIRWKKVDAEFGPLPASLHVFTTSDSLDDHPFIGYYVSVKLKDKKLSFGIQTGHGNRFTPLQYYQQEKIPLLVVNCSFFSFESNQNLSLLINNGKLISPNIVSLRGAGRDSVRYYYPTRSAIGINKKRRSDIAWIFTDTSQSRPYAFEKNPVTAKGRERVPTVLNLGEVDWKWWKMQTAVGGGPTLVHERKIRITNQEEQMYVGQENEKQPRTAMGYISRRRLVILVVEGRFPGVAEGATLEQEAKILKDLGCYKALNLDGGGSSCLLINGKETIRPSDKEGERPLPAVFVIRQQTVIKN